MILRLSMALGNDNKKSVDDAAFEIAPDTNEPNPSTVEDADLPNTFFNPSLVNWNWDEVILIPSDDDEANVNEPIPLPVEDADVEIAPHHNPFFNPKLLNWNWDDVIVIPSDDDEPQTNISSHIIDVHVDVEELARATTAKLDRIWVDLIRKEIKSLLDKIDAAEHRIESDTNVVEGLMKLILQNMKDKAK
uniref:Uncharacterized protein n=1 Tax=Tanacetum cinerariifolium TaxID=118510 RepID=A0A699GXU0_TANCI|nr:hypothetical protein [Tanacetum cinerariifolium]